MIIHNKNKLIDNRIRTGMQKLVPTQLEIGVKNQSLTVNL